MPRESTTPFVTVEEEDGEKGISGVTGDNGGHRRGGLRLRREAMQRDELRRARSWSFVGAIVLLAGALQLATLALRSIESGDRLSIWLPAALAAGCVFLALRLFRRGRRLSATLAAARGA